MIDSSFADGSELDRITKVTNRPDGFCGMPKDGRRAGDLTPSDAKKGPDSALYSSGEIERLQALYATYSEYESRRCEFEALQVRRDRRSYRQAWWMIAKHALLAVSMFGIGGAVIGSAAACVWSLLSQ